MNVKDMKIAVLGAGTMGRSVAQLFAMNGHSVWLYNRTPENLEKALVLIKSSLTELISLDMVKEEEIPAIMARIRGTSNLKEAVEDADFISESVAENRDIKTGVYNAIDEYAKDSCIVTSDTSTMNIFEFIRIRNMDKLAIVHFFNPAYVMPLVEVVKGDETSDETVAVIKELLINVGKKVAVLNKAIPGFILNRITLAVFREVTYIAGMGYASPEDIDTAIVSTFGPRYAFEGPFGLVDFAGSELYKRLAELLFPEISDAKVPPQLIQDMIDSGKLGVRSGEGFYHYDHPETAGGKREVKITRMIQAINKVNEELGGYND